MDFFQAQDNARKKTTRLVLYYIAAILAINAAIYALIVGIFYAPNSTNSPELLWQPELLAGTFTIVTSIILLSSLFKISSLRSGGGAIARSLGGQLIHPDTTNPKHRQLLNIVEEMAIASGTRVPETYVLPEASINAFAAGYSPDDAAVAVTQGTLDHLNRSELQGVIAHEFSHILNGDMRLNIRLIGLLFGILVLTIIGRVLFQIAATSNRRSSKNDKNPAALFFILGLALILIGWIGVFFARLIQAAISRQREFLADASAVQFTRNPDGIANALKKIGALSAGSRITNPHATETSHLFFANALSGTLSNLFATHPPLATRIRAIDPSFTGNFTQLSTTTNTRANGTSTQQFQQQPTTSSSNFAGTSNRSTPAPLNSEAAVNLTATQTVLDKLPPSLLTAAHDQHQAPILILALFGTLSNTTPNGAAAPNLTRGSAAEKSYSLPATRYSLLNDAVAPALTPAGQQLYTTLLPQLAVLPPDAHLPLLDLALPAFRTLPAQQTQKLLSAIDALIAADNKITLREISFHHILHRSLQPPNRRPAKYRHLSSLAPDLNLLLNLLAHADTSSSPGAAAPSDYSLVTSRYSLLDGEAATAAFSAALATLPENIRPQLAYNPTPPNPAQLPAALNNLDASTPAIKKQILTAALALVRHDNKITPAETELLRALSAALNSPLL